VKAEDLLQDAVLNPPASEAAVRDAASALGIALPADYVEFLRKHNGGEGFVGDNSVILFRAEDLKRFNDEYQINDNAPGLVLFGSNGGGEGYAFDARAGAMSVVRIPFIGMELRYARPIGENFTDMFHQLSKQ
jgi:SMI1 / KNR4 family (SUKH-1)